MNCQIKKVDFLVVGSGIAGLSFALKVSQSGKVLVTRKGEGSDTNTNKAQGGIACPLYPPDSIESHLNDTLEAGVGLVNLEAAEILTREGPERIKELIGWGADFVKNGDHYQLSREAAHSFPRIIHSLGFTTGREIQKTLLQTARRSPIEFQEKYLLLDLYRDNDGVKGGIFWDLKENRLQIILAPVTLLATGGCGAVYLYNTNLPFATGDGIGSAYRAGAELEDMEMVQFHPTAIYSPQNGILALASEAVRGEGAILKNSLNRAFMENYHPLKDLAPRDVASRAIFSEMQKTGSDFVYLDISAIPDFAERFSFINQVCRDNNLDLSGNLIPVRPAMHYLIGGVKTDLNGKTNLPGLYAAGETACTGVHGANRLASNSLLEGLVFAHRAAERAKAEFAGLASQLGLAADSQSLALPQVGEVLGNVLRVYPGVRDKFQAYHLEIKRLMMEKVGIVREENGLKIAQRTLRKMADELAQIFKPAGAFAQTFPPATDGMAVKTIWELANMLNTALLITRFALERTESRGAHYRSDFPQTAPEWKKHLTFHKS